MNAGLGDEPRRVLKELCAIQLVDVILPTKVGPEIRRTCVTAPTPHQRILLKQLGLDLPLQWENRGVQATPLTLNTERSQTWQNAKCSEDF